MTTDTETKLADALRPFANLLQPHHSTMPNDRPVYGIDRAEFTVGDLRRANKALAAHDTARAQPASAPGGWVVVPSAPTSAMVEACVKLKLDRLKGFMEGDYEPKDVRQSTVEDWLAMLAAAPQPAKECDR